MEGVSFVALHFLLSMDAEIGDRSRPQLFDFLPDIAATTEENDRQRAEMAARIACAELSSAALSATGRFPDEANRLLDSDCSLDDLCTVGNEVRKRIEDILADMPVPNSGEPASSEAVAKINPDIEGPRDDDEESNSVDDGDEDLIHLFPRTKAGIDHERLIDVGRVLESAISAAEAVHRPTLCTTCIKSAMRLAAMIIETEQFTDSALRSMRRILDVQTETESERHLIQ